MNIIRQMLMQQLVRIVAPTSPAYGNASNLPFVKEQSMNQMIKNLQIGDIIFTKTNNSLYQGFRRFLGTEYDHVSVVINQHEVIHISPPIISKIQIQRIVNKFREPLIFRVDFSQKEGGKQTYLSILHNFIGQKYNECALPSLIKNQFAFRVQKMFMSLFDIEKAKKKNSFDFSLQTMKYSRICSEAILYALCRGRDDLSGKIDKFVEQQTMYGRLGFILPNQLKLFLQQNKIEIVYNGQLTPQTKPQKTLLDHFQNSKILQKLSQKLSEVNFSIMSSSKQLFHLINKISEKINLSDIKQKQKLRYFAALLKVLTRKNAKILVVSVILKIVLERLIGNQQKQRKEKIEKLFLCVELAMNLLEIFDVGGKPGWVHAIKAIKPKL